MTDTSPLAFSYIRFSTPEQAKGDSLRRQTEAARVWCERQGLTLDTSTSLHDLGRSAYTGSHRRNPDRHALAGFLKLVESGRVPRGSYLVIESLDRLSREHIQPALLLVLNLLQAGIRIVQLKPTEMVFDDKSDTLPVMMMMVELSRGHSESAMKSDRVGKAWQEKRRRVRSGEPQKPTARMGKGSRIMTHRLPAWVEEKGGEAVLIPERAAAVRRIFALAAAGYGYRAIVQTLTREGVPAFGEVEVKEGKKRSQFSGRWTLPYVVLILTDRRAIGECQMCSKGREPDGPPEAGYFPAVVTEQEWDRAQAPRPQKGSRTRIGKHVNLFAGLVTNARNGDAYIAATKPNRVLISAGHQEGRCPSWSFPLAVFEWAILSALGEIDPREILNGHDEPDPIIGLTASLTSVEARIGALEAELESGDVPSVVRGLRALEAKRDGLLGQLAEARKVAAHPLSEAWGETQSLTEVLANAPDPTDARIRLRSALRRVVSGIHLLVVPAGTHRLAMAQVRFNGSAKVRTYSVVYRPGSGPHVKAGWAVKAGQAEGTDLTTKRGVEKAEADLTAFAPHAAEWLRTTEAEARDQWALRDEYEG